MEYSPIRDPRLIEALEACRPGRDDLSDPALAEWAARVAGSPELSGLHQRMQRLDGSLADAFADVAVPEGLSQRLVSGLGAVPQPNRATVRFRRTLRYAAAIALTAVAASLAAMVWIRGSGPQQRTVDLELAIEQFHRDSEVRGTGQLIDQAAPPAATPLSETIVPYGGIRWRAVGDFQGRKGVAYDLRSPQGTAATLYALRATATGVPQVPPAWPSLTTGGLCVAAWQEGAVLYVLVIHGGSQHYREFFQLQDGPLA